MEGANKVMVAEVGNKRKNVSKEDLVQAVNDIKNWFLENHADVHGSVIKDKNSVGGTVDQSIDFLSQFGEAHK